MRCSAREVWIANGPCSGRATLILTVAGFMLPLCDAHRIVPHESTIFTLNVNGALHSGFGALRQVRPEDEDLLEVQEVLLS